ncbi:Uncharacterised protein [Mycobacteroides abscessus subsp. abscessus]|nr:Uncharacterised protein [Mycobacteroides abscessus subsp. abscessus]
MASARRKAAKSSPRRCAFSASSATVRTTTSAGLSRRLTWIWISTSETGPDARACSESGWPPIVCREVFAMTFTPRPNMRYGPSDGADEPASLACAARARPRSSPRKRLWATSANTARSVRAARSARLSRGCASTRSGSTLVTIDGVVRALRSRRPVTGSARTRSVRPVRTWANAATAAISRTVGRTPASRASVRNGSRTSRGMSKRDAMIPRPGTTSSSRSRTGCGRSPIRANQ